MSPAYFVSSGDVKLAVYTWGESALDKPTVVLVHGFPDSAQVWQAIAQQLAQYFYVVAYDVRGAGVSSKPIAVKDYDLALLSADLVAVLNSLPSSQKVHLVGHDWGGIQSWESVTDEKIQTRLASFTCISAPCLDHMGFWMQQRLGIKPAGMKQVLRQLKHSWYIGFFQIPVIAPTLWRNFGHKLWPLILKNKEKINDAKPNPTQAQDGEYGVNLYKANMLKRVLYPQERYTRIPVQVIIVTDDNFMIPDIWQGIEKWVSDLSIVEMTGGHWLILNKPKEFAADVQKFVQKIEQTISNDNL
jgi:pimeloyl-ACP methyl ester carboxylesterase